MRRALDRYLTPDRAFLVSADPQPAPRQDDHATDRLRSLVCTVATARRGKLELVPCAELLQEQLHRAPATFAELCRALPVSAAVIALTISAGLQQEWLLAEGRPALYRLAEASAAPAPACGAQG